MILVDLLIFNIVPDYTFGDGFFHLGGCRRGSQVQVGVISQVHVNVVQVSGSPVQVTDTKVQPSQVHADKSSWGEGPEGVGWCGCRGGATPKSFTHQFRDSVFATLSFQARKA